MKLSIVATLYKSAPYLAEFHRRTGATAHDFAGDDYEIVLVNDGSPDDSLAMAIAMTEQDAHVVLVDLSRNFGHHKAIMTGLAHANGDFVFLIDSDLEERPEWLVDFAQRMEDGGGDVAYGVQARRNDPLLSRAFGTLFYKLLRALTTVDIPDNIATVRLMSRRYVNALLMHREREIFVAGLWAITGFTQIPVTVDKTHKGSSTYTFRRRLALFANSIVSFSSLPLVAIFFTGLFISLAAFLYVGWLVANWLFFARPPAGWTSVMASVWLLGGINMAFLGILGIYAAKIFSETKQRPLTIVRAIYGHAVSPGAPPSVRVKYPAHPRGVAE